MKISNNSKNQAILLVWKEKDASDVSKYEIFARLSFLFRKYTGTDLGITQNSLNNYLAANCKEGEPVMYENNKVRVLRTRAYDKGDYPPTEEEKEYNLKKVAKAKAKKEEIV